MAVLHLISLLCGWRFPSVSLAYSFYRWVPPFWVPEVFWWYWLYMVGPSTKKYICMNIVFECVWFFIFGAGMKHVSMDPWNTNPACSSTWGSFTKTTKKNHGINEPYKEKVPVSYKTPSHLVSMFFFHTFLVFFSIWSTKIHLGFHVFFLQFPWGFISILHTLWHFLGVDLTCNGYLDSLDSAQEVTADVLALYKETWIPAKKWWKGRGHIAICKEKGGLAGKMSRFLYLRWLVFIPKMIGLVEKNLILWNFFSLASPPPFFLCGGFDSWNHPWEDATQFVGEVYVFHSHRIHGLDLW